MSHKSTLKSLLRDGKVVFVRFRKVNGEIRNMICTTNMDIIPVCDRPKGDFEYDKDQIRVYDVVARGWRSMKSDRLMEVVEYTALVG